MRYSFYTYLHLPRLANTETNVVCKCRIFKLISLKLMDLLILLKLMDFVYKIKNSIGLIHIILIAIIMSVHYFFPFEDFILDGRK